VVGSSDLGGARFSVRFPRQEAPPAGLPAPAADEAQVTR
jgi:hypothetical protein